MALEIRSPRTPDEWNAYYELRYNLLRKPLGQPKGTERNGGDQSGIHLALYSDHQLIAIARLDKAETKTGQVRFVATDSLYRGKGFGRLIMHEAEKRSIERGDEKMILQARENAIQFYEKIGYKIVRKTHLLYGQVQHYLMEKIY